MNQTSWFRVFLPLLGPLALRWNIAESTLIPEGESQTTMTSEETRTPLSEDEAMALASEAVELAGGTRQVYRNPRHPFALNPTTIYELAGRTVELRHGEISSPAIVTVDGWVFEIHDEEIELLMRPVKRRT
jgi:hypothetical protein